MTGWALAWRLARRELDWRIRGLRLLFACLFLGVAALAAIGSLTQAITGELEARGRTILGGDIQLEVSQRTADPDELAAMQALGPLSTTIRMQANAVRDTAAGPRSAPIELKAVDAAYPLYGTLALTDGRSGTDLAADRAWIGTALAERLNLDRGGTVRFGNARFTVDGIIADEPDRLGEGFTLGPVAIISVAGMERTALVQPGSLYETKYRVRLTPGREPTDAVETFTAAFPEAGWDSRTRDRASPGTDRFIGRMGEFLMLVGLSALIIAGIGVGNGVSSYLAARRRSIAALKVLGATSGMIARIYWCQIAVVAALGIAAGLLVGVAAVPAILALAGDVLPVAPAFAIQWQPLGLAALYGGLIAMAFTLRPLIEAGQTPAAGLLRVGSGRRALPLRRTLLPVGLALAAIIALVLATADRPLLSGGFLLAVAATLALLAGLGIAIRALAARAPRSRRPLVRLAIAALHRPAAQTVALVVALGLGLTLFVLLAAIRTSIEANIAGSIPERAPSLIAIDLPPEREAEFQRIVAGTEPAAVISTVPTLRGTITGYGTTRVADLEELPEGAWALGGERGLTYAASLPPGSTLTEGRWWRPDHAGPPLVSLDANLGKALDLKLGDPIRYTLLGVERTATIASFRRIDWDTLGFNFVMVFSPNAIADAPHNLAATIELPQDREPAVMAALLPGFPSVSLVEVKGLLGQVRTVVEQMATAITAAASVAILAGIAVLVGAIAASREARTYDGIILRTLGATRRQVLASQAIEYALLSAALALVALTIGLGGGWYVVTQIFEFDWAPDPGTVAATLGVGMATTMGLGLAGAYSILGTRPAAALRTL